MPLPAEQLLGGAANGTKNLVATITGALLLGTTGFRVFKTVPEKHMGIMTHWKHPAHQKNRNAVEIGGKVLRKGHTIGDLHGIVAPGNYKVMPFAHDILLVSVADVTENLGHFDFTNDQKQLKTAASVIWHVRADGDNPYRAHYNVRKGEELPQTVRPP